MAKPNSSATDKPTTPTASIFEKDHYATHLGAIDKNNPVIAAQDIVNDRGVLIAKQGSRIDPVTAQKLIQHRLTQPIEGQVFLSQSITIEILQANFKGLLAQYPDIQAVHVAHKFEHDFDLLLRGWRIHPVLAQKLTVLRERMPPEFQKALFSAWLSALLARGMGLNISEQRAVSLLAAYYMTLDFYILTRIYYINPVN